MSAALPLNVLVDEPQLGFEYEGSALQRMLRSLPVQIASRQSPQLVVYKGQQFLHCFRVAIFPAEQQDSCRRRRKIRHSSAGAGILTSDRARRIELHDIRSNTRGNVSMDFCDTSRSVWKRLIATFSVAYARTYVEVRIQVFFSVRIPIGLCSIG